MAVGAATLHTYIVGSLVYAFGVGLAYSAFTAFVLVSMGAGAAATKYNVFASLSNFPIWWVGLLLGWVADRTGPTTMLLTESGPGVLGVLVFATAVQGGRRSPAR
jgi:PAT family beta-lactamase induction signal transducer AmpG